MSGSEILGESQWIQGKVCLITGGNSGIGKFTAIGLARMGAIAVMVSRDRAKGEAARDEIIRSSGAKSESVELMIADLTSLDSVRRLASDFLQTHSSLHVLVNNAGLILAKRTVTKDGLETTFETNYLSHFLLTNLLLETLKSSAPSRIINVTSDAHLSGHLDFEDLQLSSGYGAMKAYSRSKLSQILFTYELAKRLKGTGVTVNCVHPGVVATNWGRKSAGLLSFAVKFAGPFSLSSEKGADTSVYLASSPEVASVTGAYFTKRKQVRSSRESYDEAEAQRLWQVSMKLAGLSDS
ncbi:MAG: SDR family oxidoreductase [Thaumarchaeota archaeon]|nr:SDR family oxidoreductase [Nitrososphaerota archaeon]